MNTLLIINILWIIIGIPVLILVISVISVYTSKKNRNKINLGRDEACEIQVDDNFEDVSRFHASIFIKDKTLVFEDKSSNGSYVNEQKVHNTRQNIKRNDVIKLGESYEVSWDDIKRHYPDFFLMAKTSMETRKNK